MFAPSLPTAPSPAVIPHEISLNELRAALASPHPPRIAEILGPQYFAQGHLPGAVCLPLDGFADSAARLLPDREAAIVVYCASDTCQNSDIAARKLLALGYTQVRAFKGGKAAWKAANLPLEL